MLIKHVGGWSSTIPRIIPKSMYPQNIRIRRLPFRGHVLQAFSINQREFRRIRTEFLESFSERKIIPCALLHLSIQNEVVVRVHAQGICHQRKWRRGCTKWKSKGWGRGPWRTSGCRRDGRTHAGYRPFRGGKVFVVVLTSIDFSTASDLA